MKNTAIDNRKNLLYNLKEIYKPIEKDLEKVEALLKENLPTDTSFIGGINNHILSTQGKMVRPALVLLSAKIDNLPCTKEIAAEPNPEPILLSAGIELIHTASLVHDDVIDETELRRNKVTLNRKWGNQTAVLFGDSLYAHAISLLSQNVPSEIVSLISEATEKMCFGEMEQVKNKTSLSLSEKEYLKIIKNKTAALMSVCCQTGAILSGLKGKQVAYLKEYGLNFGMAYQIIDDYLDSQDKNEVALPQITSYDYAFQKAQYYVHAAKRKISAVGVDGPQSEYKESLYALADYVMSLK